MKRIFKYCLQITDVQKVMVPKGGKVLHVGLQRNALCVWIEVDIEKVTEERTFVIVGTGNPFPDDCIDNYLGTVQMSSFVWHVYEW